MNPDEELDEVKLSLAICDAAEAVSPTEYGDIVTLLSIEKLRELGDLCYRVASVREELDRL